MVDECDWGRIGLTRMRVVVSEPIGRVSMAFTKSIESFGTYGGWYDGESGEENGGESDEGNHI